ncbi:MAG: YCF48-related protein [Planctomycetota bacterium]
MRVIGAIAGIILLCVVLVVLARGCGSGSDTSVEKKAAVIHEAKGQAQVSQCSAELRDIFFMSRATLPHGATLPPNWPEIDKRVGFVVGANSAILKTADGGQTWKYVSEPKEGAPTLDAVRFLNPMEGWAVGRDLGLHTADGGETWTPAPSLPGIVPYYGSSTATATSFLVIKPPTCGATLYKALDGGKKWHDAAGLPKNDYAVVFFFDDLHGWISGNHGMFAMTKDGGKTWEEHGIENGEDLCILQFLTPEVGRMRDDRTNGILTTADGGKTWQAKSAGLATYWGVPDMQWLDTKAGFLLVHVEPDNTHVFRTLDGGDTWETIGKHKTELTAMSFVDPSHGWVVGPSGCIFHYDLGPFSDAK